MEISSIEGVGKFGDGLKKVVKKATTVVKKAGGAVVDAVKDAAENVVDAAKTIGLAPGRGAFLLLVQFNVRGLATKLSKTDQNKLHSKWNDLGGNFTTLTEAVNKGKGKSAVFGINGIGVGGEIAAAIVTAAPILVAILSFLKANHPELSDEELNGLTTDAEIAWSNSHGGDMSGFDFLLQRGYETPSANDNLNNDPGNGGGSSSGGSSSGGSGINLNIAQLLKDYWYVPVGLGAMYFFNKKR